MRIVFDPIKDASKQIKHVLSLGMSVELDWESARRIISLRRVNRREVKHYVENF